MSPSSSTPVAKRLLDAAVEIKTTRPRSFAFNYSVLCQIFLPYQVHEGQRVWHRVQGMLSLQLEADPDSGLPFGPRARLLLVYLVTQAVRAQSPTVSIGRSPSDLVRCLGMAVNGKNIRQVREQLRRIAGCRLRLTQRFRETTTLNFEGELIEPVDIAQPARTRARVPWPLTVTLAPSLFAHIRQHAVPLDPRALRALQHSAAALDTYCWLTQRLSRIAHGQVVEVSWKALFDQFGGSTRQLSTFKQNWRGRRGNLGTLDQVLLVYPAACDAVRSTLKGVNLEYANPPIPRKPIAW